MTKTSKLQAEIQEKEAQLLELQGKRRQAKEQIDGLEAERRGFAVAARVHKNADAQKSIERIAAKIAKAADEDTLNGEAFTQLSGELEATKAELRREQWREQCDPVRQLLKERVGGTLEREALKAALTLRDALEVLDRKDREIIAALQHLHHPLLAGPADLLRAIGERRGAIISFSLEPFLENPFSRAWKETFGKDPTREVARVFGEALKTLDSVAEMEPEGQPA